MIKAGVDPWVVHFFAFFLAVWGELTPPTSVVAAVAVNIAHSSFMGTLFRAIGMCIGLFVLMGAIFSRPHLVLEPGIHQIAAFELVLCGTIGLAFSFQTTFSDNRVRDPSSRAVLVGLSLLIILYPDLRMAWAGVLPVAVFVAYWIVKRRPKLIET